MHLDCSDLFTDKLLSGQAPQPAYRSTAPSAGEHLAQKSTTATERGAGLAGNVVHGIWYC